ncbi:MAG: aminotransferase class I/II-fold pyridoxal phosphate-dependent enzyme [Clostridiales bacterium]|jgi:aminotransferase|nr:aminotransferase class I/II-fold pyridoxal phosphate-dependent enzyme [Clostridiales bacterium]
MRPLSELVSPTVSAMPSSGIRKFFDIVSEMGDAISLGVGEPDFVTPWSIREAAIYSLERGRTYYTSNSGLIELREAICGYAQRKFGLGYSPRREALVTVGGSEAIDLCVRALVAPGDEVLIPEPSFVCYTPCVLLAGGTPVPIVTREEDEFRLTAAQLRRAITPRTKLLVLPFPNNPTGAIMRKADLEEIAAVLRGTDILVMSDEIYGELTYDGEHTPIATLGGMKERCVLINGFSKQFAMTGWRLGYALGPEPVIAAMTKIHQYAIMCAPTASQYAACDALKNCDADVEEMKRQYNYRRRVILKGFRDMGLGCFEPLGAFYLFPNISATGLSSEEFARRLLERERVAVVPGNAFGASGEGFIRCSYAYSIENIEEALERIGRYVHALLGG